MRPGFTLCKSKVFNGFTIVHCVNGAKPTSIEQPRPVDGNALLAAYRDVKAYMQPV